MKNIILFAAFTSAILFSSCEGPEGPPGLSGINILGQVFEVNPNFQYDVSDNTFSTPIFSIPSSIIVYESDVVLAYRFDGQADIGNGEFADIWTPLPQNVFYQDGTGDIFQYNFNYTFVDIQFIIDGNFDLTTIGNEFINNQTFRIAIVPAEFGTADLTMDDLLLGLEINTIDIQKLD
jgi:hypothetical protein